MSRFAKELNGEFGEYWRKDAQKRIQEAQRDYCDGKLVITEDGVAYWESNGRAVMDDYADILEHTWMADRFSRTNTAIVRRTQNHADIAQYRKAREEHGYSDEELFEMRAAFGAGERVVDVITGKVTQL